MGNRNMAALLGACALILIGCAIIIFELVLLWNHPHKQPITQETCVKGIALLNSEYGLLAIGDQEICGVNLHFGNITGPSTLPRPVELP